MDISNKSILTVKIILFLKKSFDLYHDETTDIDTYPQPSLDNLVVLWKWRLFRIHGKRSLFEKRTIL
jgi:hypothetical protein